MTTQLTEEATLWRNSTLGGIYPIVYLDALKIMGKHNAQVITMAASLAIAVTMGRAQ